MIPLYIHDVNPRLWLRSAKLLGCDKSPAPRSAAATWPRGSRSLQWSCRWARCWGHRLRHLGSMARLGISSKWGLNLIEPGANNREKMIEPEKCGIHVYIYNI